MVSCVLILVQMMQDLEKFLSSAGDICSDPVVADTSATASSSLSPNVDHVDRRYLKPPPPYNCWSRDVDVKPAVQDSLVARDHDFLFVDGPAPHGPDFTMYDPRGQADERRTSAGLGSLECRSAAAETVAGLCWGSPAASRRSAELGCAAQNGAAPAYSQPAAPVGSVQPEEFPADCSYERLLSSTSPPYCVPSPPTSHPLAYQPRHHRNSPTQPHHQPVLQRCGPPAFYHDEPSHVPPRHPMLQGTQSRLSSQFTNTARGWLGSRVVSVLDSGEEGPGFKSQPRRCRVTVLGKLFIPIVPLFTKQRNWQQPS